MSTEDPPQEETQDPFYEQEQTQDPSMTQPDTIMIEDDVDERASLGFFPDVLPEERIILDDDLEAGRMG